MSEAAQLDHVPWEDVDRVLSNTEKFAQLRECAVNVAILQSGCRGGCRRQEHGGKVSGKPVHHEFEDECFQLVTFCEGFEHVFQRQIAFGDLQSAERRNHHPEIAQIPP